eukprot:486230-Rhodomonas_salina.1
MRLLRLAHAPTRSASCITNALRSAAFRLRCAEREREVGRACRQAEGAPRFVPPPSPYLDKFVLPLTRLQGRLDPRLQLGPLKPRRKVSLE